MIRIGSLSITVNLGSLAFATLIMAVSLWYYFSARVVSAEFHNLILIAPCVAAITILYIGTLVSEVSIHRLDAQDSVPETSNHFFRRLSTSELRIVATMVLVGLYISVVETIGFDVASFLFIGLNLILLGERRFFRLTLFSLIFSGLTSWGLVNLATFPIPTMVI